MHLAPLLALSLLLAATPVQGQFNLPQLGDPSQAVLGEAEQRRLGQAVLARIRGQGLVIDDPRLTGYLNAVGRRLTPSSSAGPFHFFLVDDPTINAFAAPGGYIGVHAGLFLAAGSEDELAGVLAHEIAHVDQHHIARAVASDRRFSVPMMAATIAAALLAAADGHAGAAGLSGVAAADAQRRLDRTRAFEREADRVGTALLKQAGYDPQGLATFFARLAEKRRVSGAAPPEFLSTHPLDSSRIAEVRDRIQDADTPANPPELPFLLARMRLEVRQAQDLAGLEARLGGQLAQHDRAQDRFGLALVLWRRDRPEQAYSVIEPLLERAPGHLDILLVAAGTALSSGQTEQGWQLFARGERLFPGDYGLALAHAEALLGQGQPQAALARIRPYAEVGSDRPQAFKVYAEAARLAGQRGESHAALAELRFLHGDLPAAIHQLTIALNTAAASGHKQRRWEARRERLRALSQPPD